MHVSVTMCPWYFFLHQLIPHSPSGMVLHALCLYSLYWDSSVKIWPRTGAKNKKNCRQSITKALYKRFYSLFITFFLRTYCIKVMIKVIGVSCTGLLLAQFLSLIFFYSLNGHDASEGDWVKINGISLWVVATHYTCTMHIDHLHIDHWTAHKLA